MANLNRPLSFQVINPERYKKPIKVGVDASYAGVDGDVVWMDNAGRASDTNSSEIYGIQQGAIIDGADGLVNSTGSSTASEDHIAIINDPAVEFAGQASLGALLDVYTTRADDAAFDIAGSAGVQYVDSSTSSSNHVKVVGTFIEPDTGEVSAVGAYQKQVFRFTDSAHYLGADS